MKLTKQQKIDLEFMQIVRKFGNIYLSTQRTSRTKIDGTHDVYLTVGGFGIGGYSLDEVIGTSLKYKDKLGLKEL